MNRARLAAVKRVRSLQERTARGELARRGVEHRRAQEAEAHTWRALQAIVPSSGSLVGDVQALRALRQAGTLAAARQRGETELASDHASAARDAWTVSARRLEALERLGERLRETDEADEERRQITEIDDLVLARRGRTPAGDAR